MNSIALLIFALTSTVCVAGCRAGIAGEGIPFEPGKSHCVSDVSPEQRRQSRKEKQS